MPAPPPLISALRQEGELDSTGAFTIDRDQARERLRHFQLSDPRRYVLLVVQAAVLKGATRVEISATPRFTRVTFDGRPFTPRDFEEIWGSLFVRGESPDVRARRRLAMALNGALALGPKELWVGSGEHRLFLGADRREELRAGWAPPEPWATTAVELAEPWWRSVWRSTLGAAVERYVAARCRFAEIEVTLNGRLIASEKDGALGPASLIECPINHPEARGVAGFFPGLEAAVDIIQDGVLVATHPLEGHLPGFGARITHDRLRLDISQESVVRDEAYDQVRTLLRAAELEVVDQLCDGSLEPGPAQVTLKLALMRYRDLATIRRDDKAVRLARVPLWRETRASGRVSLWDVIEHFDREGTAPYSTEQQPSLPTEPDDPVPLLLGRDEVVFFQNLFGDDARNQRRRLRDELTGKKKARVWRSRRLEPELGRRTYLATTPIDAPGIRGELGLGSLSNAWSRFYLIKDGGLLADLVLKLPIRGLEVLVEAEFATSRRFEISRRDPRLAAVMVAVAEQTPTLVRQLVAALPRGQPVNDSLRRFLRDYLAFISQPEPLATFIAACKLEGEAVAQASERPTAGLFELINAEPLLSLPLFSVSNAPALSLNELRTLAQNGTLAFLSADSPFADPLPAGLADGPILRPSAAERMVLAAQLPAGALVDVEPRLQRDAARAAFLQQPIAHPQLDDPTLCFLPLSAPGVTGEIGIPRHGKPGASSTITLLKDRRVLCRRQIQTPLPAIGIMACDALRPRDDWQDVVQNDTFDTILRVAREGIVALIAELVAGYEQLDPEARTTARSLLLGVAANEPGLSDPFAELALLVDAGGDAVTLAKLDRGAWRFVSEPFAPVDTEESQVLVLDGVALAAARARIGHDRLSEARSWIAQRRERRSFEALPLLDSLSLDSEPIVRVPIVSHGDPPIAGEIGLPAAHDTLAPRAAVEICHQRRLAGSIIFEDVGCSCEAIVDDPTLPLGPGAQIDRAHPRLAQLKRCLMAHLPALLDRVAEGWASLRSAERRVAWYHALDFLAAHAAGRLPTEGAEETAARLATLPGVPRVTGPPCSIAELRAAPAGELSYIDLRAPNREADGLVVELTPFELDRLSQILDTPLRRASSGAPAPLPAEPVAEISDAEGRLLAAVRGALARIREGHGDVAGDLNLHRLRMSEGGPDRIASAGPRGIRIHRRHPVVVNALAAPDSDQVAALFVTSAVITAVRHFWSGITPEDERALQHALVSGAQPGAADQSPRRRR